jgi:hypothetical protein
MLEPLLLSAPPRRRQHAWSLRTTTSTFGFAASVIIELRRLLRSA